jgi:hypothetical protein
MVKRPDAGKARNVRSKTPAGRHGLRRVDTMASVTSRSCNRQRVRSLRERSQARPIESWPTGAGRCARVRPGSASRPRVECLAPRSPRDPPHSSRRQLPDRCRHAIHPPHRGGWRSDSESRRRGRAIRREPPSLVDHRDELAAVVRSPLSRSRPADGADR